MPKLQAYDFGVWPSYLCRGRKPIEQAVIAWLWAYAVAGKAWSLSELSCLCGAKVDTDLLQKLVADGLLLRDDNPLDSKACNVYHVNCEFVPEHDAPEGKKKAKRMVPMWAFQAAKIWERYRGVIGPGLLENMLKAAVGCYGPDTVLKAFDVYAEQSTYPNPNPSHFSATIAIWLPKAAQEFAQTTGQVPA